MQLQTDNALLEEMRNINQRLVETVLELDSAQNVNRRFANAGTIVRCTYSAVSDRNNLMFHFANTLKVSRSLAIFLFSCFPARKLNENFDRNVSANLLPPVASAFCEAACAS